MYLKVWFDNDSIAVDGFYVRWGPGENQRTPSTPDVTPGMNTGFIWEGDGPWPDTPPPGTSCWAVENKWGNASSGNFWWPQLDGSYEVTYSLTGGPGSFRFHCPDCNA